MFKSQRSFFQHIKWITPHFQHHTVNHQFHLLKKPRKPQPNYPTLIMPTALGPVSCTFIIYQFLNQTTKMDKWKRIFSKKNISECFRRWNSKVVRFVLLGFVVLVFFFILFAFLFVHLQEHPYPTDYVSFLPLEKNLKPSGRSIWCDPSLTACVFA